MNAWADLPTGRLLTDVSLWSADLANLAAEIERMQAFADSFHLDVADAHFAPSLLFFPDLIRALRPHTNLPFHVHLMVDRPTQILPDLLAYSDLITVHAENGESEATAAIEAIRRAGRSAGLALRLDTPVKAAQPYLGQIETLLLLGTEIGVKGQDLSPLACARLENAWRMIRGCGVCVRLIADGGIRPHSVPLLRGAGADAIVPGSLLFQSQNLPETIAWLHGL